MILIVGIIAFNYFSTKVSPVIMKYAEIETKKFSNIIINNAVGKVINEKASSEEIFKMTQDQHGDIKAIDFNTIKINEYLTKATQMIQKDMNNIEKGNIYSVYSIKNLKKRYIKKNLKKGIVFYISSGIAFSNPLLSNIGPKIPVKISLTGDVISYVSAEVEEYGINNSLIKVSANFKVVEEIILPFYGKNITMNAKVPIAIKMVTGKTPEYYYGSNQTPKLVIPNS